MFDGIGAAFDAMLGLISALFVAAIIGVACSIGLGVYTFWFAESGDDVRAEAIDAGVAEWRIDPKTGDRSFHWINESEQ